MGKKARFVLEDRDDGPVNDDRRRLTEWAHRSFDSLPDEIAAAIVDRLGWKDAAKTSVLSHRFHKVWKSCVLHRKILDFEESGALANSNFLECVNHVLRIHEGLKVNSLRICFGYLSRGRGEEKDDFVIKVKDGFENWLAFARAKSVLRLDIDLHHLFEVVRDFTLQFLGAIDGWDKLTSLTLNSVQVADADLERGLKSHLINLESLVIIYASNLERVVVASPKLKKLRLKECPNICMIDIVSAPNLECFQWEHRYCGELMVRLQHVPKLSQVFLGRNALCDASMLEFQKVEKLEKLELRGNSDFPLQSAMFRAWDKLTSLSLELVTFDDAEFGCGLKWGLINLESLFVEHAQHLEDIVIASPKLKKLVIRYCASLFSISIDSAPNLQYFEFHHNGEVEDGVHFRDVPKLSHVSFHLFDSCLNHVLSTLQNVEMLEKLELEVSPRCKNSEHVCVPNPAPFSPLLSNLKELQCRFRVAQGGSIPLMIFTFILAACPKLQRLTFDRRSSCYGNGEMKDEWLDLAKDQLRSISLTHHCLEKVEFFGWSEQENEVETVNYLKEIAPNLKQLTYHPTPMWLLVFFPG